MIRTLLVGLDGSTDSDAALELGIRWARRLDALLVGMAVVDEPGIHGSEEVWLGEVYFRRINEGLTSELRHKLQRVLERAALRCAEAGVAFKELEGTGDPQERILTEAQRYDLILMGQHTHFRFGWQDHADDTLRRVLAASPRPVVAVPQKLVDGENILIAYDGSLQAARALQIFQATGLAHERTVDVLSIAPTHALAVRPAERAVEFLRFHQIRAQSLPREGSATAQAILETAAERKAGLIVMGAYGQPTLREMFLGSVTRSVLKDSAVPVFLAH
jgi:nucleotide-binding universal stress UspA family protein